MLASLNYLKKVINKKQAVETEHIIKLADILFPIVNSLFARKTN